MTIQQKLLNVQLKLKAPKSNYNSFSKFNYRSCEDILEAVKPILEGEKLLLMLSDEIVQIGDRNYVKATATLLEAEKDGQVLQVVAYAREDENKKGMDSAQLTGATSSYARKYALNGLFLIDDTKDMDTDEFQKQKRKPVSNPLQAIYKEVIDGLDKVGKSKQDFMEMLGEDYGVEKFSELTLEQAKEVKAKILQG